MVTGQTGFLAARWYLDTCHAFPSNEVHFFLEFFASGTNLKVW